MQEKQHPPPRPLIDLWGWTVAPVHYPCGLPTGGPEEAVDFVALPTLIAPNGRIRGTFTAMPRTLRGIRPSNN